MSNDNSVGEITNEEEALTAVRQFGKALRFVPEKLKAAELCLEAVKQDGEALYLVPELLQAEVRAALKNAAHIGLK